MAAVASIEDAEDILKRSRDDPVWFIKEVLGDKGWLGQYEIIEAIRDHRRVAVKSCNSAGKDWISARVALWFLGSFFPSLVITTGPSDRQVKKILWRELAKAHSRARWPLGGQLITQELKLDTDQLAIGFTTTNDPEKFSGFHEKNILVIVDESSGVSTPVHEAIETVLSGGNNYKLDIGNPTDPACEFASFFKTPGIKKITITAFDTPNFTQFGLEEKDFETDAWRDKIDGPLPMPMLITPDWVHNRTKKWGKNNPWYESRIQANFPSASKDTLIPIKWIEAAQNRTLEPGKPNVLGVDVGRGGDPSAIAHRRGPVLRIIERFSNIDTMETVGHVRIARRTSGAEESIVDVIGLGAGVVDRLREQREPVRDANAAEAANDTDRFANARAEWFWTMREDFETGNVDLDPEDEDLAAQLSDIHWKPNSRGQILIESKEDMAKRGMESPNDADAAAHTYVIESSFSDQMKKAMENVGGL